MTGIDKSTNRALTNDIKIKSEDEDEAMLEDSDKNKNIFIKIKKENPLCESNNKVTVDNEKDEVQSLTVTNPQHFPDPNLISRDFSQKKALDIQVAVYQSKTKDNVIFVGNFCHLLFY